MSSLGMAARTLVRSIFGVIATLPDAERDELIQLIRRELRLLEQVAAEEQRQREQER